HAGDGAHGLLQECQVVRRGGGDIEEGGGGPGEAPGRGGQGVAGAGFVDRERAERGDAAAGGDGRRAAEGAAAGVGADGDGDAGGGRGPVVELVDDLHGYRGADEDAGGGGRRRL